jgi:hypothetical protein
MQTKMKKPCVTWTIFAALCLTLLSRSAVLSQTVQTHPDVSRALKHDVSPPLRDIKPVPSVPGPPRVNQRLWPHPPKITPYQRDLALQTSRGPLISVTSGLNFDGINEAAQQIASRLLAIPPDTNGAVGGTQFVQWVNYAIAVFDLTKRPPNNVAYGPAAGKTLWKGFGGPCETNNSGDPIAQYDKIEGRWVLTQPVFTNPFYICFAVSTTSDATGTYHRYAFQMPNFPDYPKLGIWPDAYYMSMDLYTGQGYGGKFLGAYACAFDRSAMLNGQDATKQCFQLNSNYASLLPSDLDGTTAPPAGSPNSFMNLGSDSKSLNLWQFHADFVNPNKSALSPSPNKPIIVPVDQFTEACGGGICILQPGTKTQLDSLGDRLMYRLAYRNFGSRESLVVNHSVTVGSSVGLRWYEIRNPGSQPYIYQRGTFAPQSDGNFRWMGSMAMDKAGDIAVGYSVSSSSIFPEIRFTGRVPTDTLGTLGAEQTIVFNPPPGGSQLKLSNWGDYSSMSIDPADDCTFWYTTEYLPASGNYNWNTRIASFKFSSCQ